MEKFIKPEYTFVFFALVFGFILIFFTPPFQSPDEPAHFAKAFSVSQGHFVSKKVDNVSGDNLPSSLLTFEERFGNLFFNTASRTSFQQVEESKKVHLNENNKTFVNQKYHAMYSPLAYLPQGAGIFVFKFFTDSVYWLMIGAKMFLLFFYIAMGYLSVKSVPFCKWLTVLILLMPMSLSLGASVSADGVLIAVSVLYFAKVLQYTYQKDRVCTKQTVLLVLSAIALTLIKQSFLISLFVLFIPSCKFGKNYWLKLSLILLPAFVVSVLWSKLGYSLFVPMNGSNPEIQIKFIIEHPFVYAMTLLKTLQAYFFALIYSTIGILGWLDVFMFPFMYWLYITLMFLNIIFQPGCECKSFASNNFQKCLLPSLIITNFVVICTIIYVSWAIPYLISPFEGLQGRYFIPLLLPLFTFFFLLVNKKNKYGGAWLPITNIIFLILVYLNIIFGLFIRYYATF